ncbi:MAG: 30S ribosomal protein S17 [Candidatus Halalkalibacterium sp. M3_1C_030]
MKKNKTEVLNKEETMAQTERAQRRQRTGKVVSDRMDKTITVAVDRQIKHPIYGKFITKTTKYLAHDEENDANTGDTVQIMSTRPLSKRKTWRLVDILERAK